MDCTLCKQNCTRSCIECSICGNKFHAKCLTDSVPKTMIPLVDSIKKSNGHLIYRCDQCVNLTPSNKSAQDQDQLLNKKLDNLELKIKEVANILSNSVLSDLTSIKSDLKNCVSRVESFEESTNLKIEKLQTENNFLHKQFNRGNITISGLPEKLTVDDLYTTVHKIAEVLDIDLQPHDINHCTWTRNKKIALIKFNSIRKRDELTQSYFKNQNLKLSQVIADYHDIESRIYINDHLTPMAAALQFICKKLKFEKKITKFQIRNRIIPEVKLFFPDGSTKIAKREEVQKMLN